MSSLVITGITGKNGKYLFQELLNNEPKIASMFSDGIKFSVRDTNKARFITESSMSLKYQLLLGDTTNKAFTD